MHLTMPLILKTFSKGDSGHFRTTILRRMYVQVTNSSFHCESRLRPHFAHGNTELPDQLYLHKKSSSTFRQAKRKPRNAVCNP